ncbi:MAG TPA: hypothetical protein VGS41_18245, partial [Chthonomonadales bacterium]|nr:hypothetical protein [Chthonomonadales bacterium]
CLKKTAFVRSPSKRWFIPRSPLAATVAAITYPSSGTAVDLAFTCRGTVTRCSRKTHLWLAAEQQFPRPRIWPKESEIVPDETGNWEQNVHHQAPEAEFRLALYAASHSAHRKILKWLDQSNGTGTWCELYRPAGMVRVQLVMLRSGESAPEAQDVAVVAS